MGYNDEVSSELRSPNSYTNSHLPESEANMKAAQFFGRNDIRIIDTPAPTPESLKPDEVLVSIEWCGICGSDLHEFAAGPIVIPTPERPHSLTKETLPVTMGHEFCGRISHASEAHPHLKLNDPVMVDPRLYCRSCHLCASDQTTHACRKWGFLGLSGGGGGFSETVAVDARMCYKLPETIPLEYAALIEPLTVAHHGVKASGIEDFTNKTALIIGGGPIGIATVFVLRVRGAKTIIVSEPTVSRRAQNEEIADHVIDPTKENVGDFCRKLTGGKGADVAFDCAGVIRGLESGLDSLGYEGIYIDIAVWETPFIVRMADLMLKEITIKGSMAYNDEDFREVVEAFAQGKYKGVEKMVTSRIKLNDLVSSGFEELVKHKEDHVKILVSPKA